MMIFYFFSLVGEENDAWEDGAWEEQEEEEFLFRLSETREEEGRLARTCLEQLYSPYEGTATHPLLPYPF